MNRPFEQTSTGRKPHLGTFPKAHGLYDPANEKDSCGVGFIAHIKGKPSHKIVSDALIMLEHMDHRGACGCEPNTRSARRVRRGHCLPASRS